MRHRDVFRQLRFLHRRVVDHVDRPLRFAHHDRVGAREGIGHAVNAAGLVIPFGKLAHRVALGEGGVNPVDERTAVFLVHRPGGADEKYRAAVDVGVVDAHGRVQEADDVVHDGDHRFAARLGVAVSDLHGDLFVITQQHRRLVLAVVDQRVVQSAIARARIERDVWEAVLLDQIDDDVGLPTLGGFFDFAFAHADLLPRANIKSGNAAPPFLMSENPPRVIMGGHLLLSGK